MIAKTFALLRQYDRIEQGQNAENEKSGNETNDL